MPSRSFSEGWGLGVSWSYELELESGIGEKIVVVVLTQSSRDAEWQSWVVKRDELGNVNHERH